MSFALGRGSRYHLVGVHPTLVAVVDRAIQISAQDFTVGPSVRTLEEQKQHLADGTSKTLQSKHLMQPDGYSHAVDLVPWIDGAMHWDWPGCYKIAAAMRNAAAERAVNLIWGGCWYRQLSSILGTAAATEDAHKAYMSIHPHGLADGPHFELA